MEWVALYKFGRLALLAALLCAIAAYLYLRSDADHFEEPARRMLEDEEGA